MRNKKSTEKIKTFDTVKTFRVIKETISEEMADMNFEQIKQYLKKASQEFRKGQEALS
ncbi:MAG: hypothetical protein NTX03_04110 [Bacteroidetes bacterium]|nr:hypothetical protein [Bacteroidota bacterium]